MPAAMAPGRANGLCVGAVGGGECRLFLQVGHEAATRPSDSASTGGYRKVGLHRDSVSGLLWVCTRKIFDTWAKRAMREYWVSTLQV